MKTNNLPMQKTKALISAFVFATRILQFLFYLNTKFQASSSFLWLYRLVCIRPVRKPHCWFSHETAQNLCLTSFCRSSSEQLLSWNPTIKQTHVHERPTSAVPAELRLKSKKMYMYISNHTHRDVQKYFQHAFPTNIFFFFK